MVGSIALFFTTCLVVEQGQAAGAWSRFLLHLLLELSVLFTIGSGHLGGLAPSPNRPSISSAHTP